MLMQNYFTKANLLIEYENKRICIHNFISDLINMRISVTEPSYIILLCLYNAYLSS